MMNEAQVIAIAEAAGIIPWSRHQFVGGKKMAHVDDGLDGDLASLLQFAKLLEEHAINEYLAKIKITQVTPYDFVEMVYEREDLIGTPLVWAQWPNEEKA